MSSTTVCEEESQSELKLEEQSRIASLAEALTATSLPDDSMSEKSSDSFWSQVGRYAKLGQHMQRCGKLSNDGDETCSDGSAKDAKTEEGDDLAEGSTSSKDSKDVWDSGVTTVMIRRIPPGQTQKKLYDDLVQHGFAGMFDFLYIPFDFKVGRNIGIAFLNFTQAQYAFAFYNFFDGLHLDLQGRGRPLQIHPADCQGFEANWNWLTRTKTFKWNDPEFSPVFLSHVREYGRQLAAAGMSAPAPQRCSESVVCVRPNLPVPPPPAPPAPKTNRSLPPPPPPPPVAS